MHDPNKEYLDLCEKLRSIPLSAREHQILSDILGDLQRNIGYDREEQQRRALDKERNSAIKDAVMAMDKAIELGCSLECLLHTAFQYGPFASINWDQIDNRDGKESPHA